MAATLLRTGLWIIFIVIAAFVVREVYAEQQFIEYLPARMLQLALVVGVVAAITGAILRMFEKGAKVVAKNRCAVCKVPIPPGAIYCRAHLRAVLHKEEDRSHLTKR